MVKKFRRALQNFRRDRISVFKRRPKPKPNPSDDIDSDFSKDKISFIESKKLIKFKQPVSIVTLFRRKTALRESKMSTALRNLDIVHDMTNKELKKRYCIKKQQIKILNAVIENVNTGKISLSNLLKYDLDSREITKDQITKLIKDYESEKTHNDISYTDLKKRFGITGSKEEILDKFVEDYKSGKLSKTDLFDNKEFKPKKMNKQKMYSLLARYEMGYMQRNKSKTSLLGTAKKRVSNLMENLKNYKSDGHFSAIARYKKSLNL